MKLRQPSRGTKAASFLPFLISCTRTHFRMAELGCLASIPLIVIVDAAFRFISPAYIHATNRFGDNTGV